jgi:nucleoside-diphosphate-sugar epimerase
MSVLITGLAGQIGSNVARMLLQRGVDVVGLDVSAPSSHSVVFDDFSRVQFEIGNVTDLARLIEIIKKHGVRRIIHTAGVIAQHADLRPVESSRTNIEGTLNVLEACRTCELDRVVCLSSSAAAGDHARRIGGRAVQEEEYDLPFEGMYGLSKFVNENHIYLYRKLWNLPAIACRPVRIWGPGFGRWDLPPAIEVMIRDAISVGQVTVSPCKLDRPLEYTYVKDHCAGLIQATLASLLPKSHVFNLGTGETYTQSEIANVIVQTLPHVEIVSAGDRSDTDLAGSYVVAERPALDLAKAKDQLGYQVKYGLKRGVPSYVKWLIDRQYL